MEGQQKKFTTIQQDAALKQQKQREQKKKYAIPPAYYHQKQELQLSKEEVLKRDEVLCSNIRHMSSDWPERYFERFQKWYIKRCEKTAHPNLPKLKFDMWSVVKGDDVLHHMKNWDSSLKKACLKSDRLKKTVNKIQKDCTKTITTYQKRWSNSKIGQPPHPHPNDETTPSLPFKNLKEYHLNPITCEGCWLEAQEKKEMVEQAQDGAETTNLESTSSLESSANITFVDERPVDPASLTVSKTSASRDVNNDIAESNWNLTKVLEREFPTITFEWKTSDAKKKKIVNEGVPKLIVDQKDSLITRQLAFFAFMRAGVKIRVQINSTKFHCGRLIVFFKPLTWNDDVEENFYSLTCYPHCFLDASISNSGTIEVPFTHLLTYFSQCAGTTFNDSINSLGSLNVLVYNPLQAAEKATQSISGQIFVSLIEPFVHLPTNPIDSFSYGTGYIQGLESIMKKGAGALINSGLGLADKYTGGLVTGVGDAVCNLLGIQDKPLDPTPPAPITNRTISPLCHGTGLDHSTRLGLCPISQTNTEPALIGSTNGDFNINTLCKLPSLIEQFEWNETHVTGTKIFDMIVTPVYISKSQCEKWGDSRVARYSPTMLAYISRAFCLWRGTLKLKIQVVKTQFHSGRLLIVHDPHGTTELNITDYLKNRSHNTVIMDIEEKQELEIDLPNYSVRPWLRCDRFRGQQQMTKDDGIENATFLDCDVAGVVRIFVLNTLVRPENVTDKIELNVMFFAGDNFELSIPNTVAPLSLRPGTFGFPNYPRYPWCNIVKSQLCDVRMSIYDLYISGLKLFNNGLITVENDWFDPKVVVFTEETLVFFSECNKLRFFIETAKEECKDYINNLPKYKSGVAEQLDKIKDNIQPGFDQINKEIKGNQTDLTKIHNKSTDILENTQNTVVKLNEIVPKFNEQVTRVNQILSYVSDNEIPNKIETVRKDIDKLSINVESVDSSLNLHRRLVETLDFKKAKSQIDAIEERSSYSADQLKDISTNINKNIRATGDVLNQVEVISGVTSKNQELIQKVLDNTIMKEQGLESYTSNKDIENPSVTITEGNKMSSVAPNTISENSMNLQTLLRRYYPVWVSGEFKNSLDFTVIAVPVTPSFAPDDVNTTVVSGVNRRYDIHNLAWFSRLYTYFRGSLRFKILVNSDNSDIYVWHNPIDAKRFTVTSGFSSDHITEQMNFATDAAVTKVQQGLEIELPYYSGFNQLIHSFITEKPDLRAQNGTLYIAVRNRNTPVNVSIFMSTGDDFMFNVLRAAPVVHEPFQFAYTNETTASDFPELQKSLGHDSNAVQLPGGPYFNRWSKGQMSDCTMPPAPTKDFKSSQLPVERQQMVEQMYSIKNFVQETVGVNEARDEYNKQVKPVIANADELLSQVKQTLAEFQNDVLPAILGHAKLFHKDVNNTHATIKDFLPKIEESLEHLNATMITYNNVGKSFMTAADSIGEAGSYISWMMRTLLISSIWLNLIELTKGFKWTTLLNIICLLCSLFHTSVTLIINWVFEHLGKIYEDYRSEAKYGRMREQGFEEFVETHNEELSLSLSVVATVIYCALFGTLPSWSYIKQMIKETISGSEQGQEQGVPDFLKSIHFNNLGLKAVNNAFNFFQNWIDKAINWFLGKDNPNVLLEKQFKEKAKLIEKWIDDIADLEDEDFYHAALSDINIHNKYYKLVDQGKEFTKWLMNEGVSKNVSAIVRDANKRLLDMIKRINQIRPGHGFRYSPFVIMLHGNSGCAKSSAMHKFTDMFRTELNIPYYNSVCTVPKTKEFLDGYEGQAIIEWDDILQCPKQDEMVAEFINWRSNADCIINKAQVEQKGMHFTSKAIVMSTNSGDIKINTIRDMNAFRNRINIKFNVTLAEGITPGDLKTLNRDPTYSFQRYEAMEPNDDGSRFVTTHRNLTFEQAMNLTRNKFQAWNRKQNDLIDNFHNDHGSLRIPRGVNIVREQDDVYHEAQDLVEQSLNVRYTVEIDSNLNEEDEIDAELFKIKFEESGEEMQESFYNRCKSKVKHISENGVKYFKLLKAKLQIHVKKFMIDLAQWYKDHPTFAKAMGIISTFTMAGFLIKAIQGMFSQEEIVPENHYDPNPKSISKVVVAENQYDPNPKTLTKVVKAENAYEPTPTKLSKNIIAENKCENLIKNVEEGATDRAAVEMGRNKIHPLLVSLGWKSDEYTLSLQGLCIGGKLILTPHHFFRRAKRGDFFYFLRHNEEILVEFDPDRMFRIRDKDACLYSMSARFESKANILNCFVKEENLSLLGKYTDSILIGTHRQGIIIEKCGTSTANAKMQYQGEDDNAPVYHQTGWSYDFNTIAGECGSILLACNPSLPPPARIIGMHVAGYATKSGGFSIILTREMLMETIQQAVNKLGAPVFNSPLPPQVIQDEQAFNEKVKIKPIGNYSYYGVMDTKFCPSQPDKTSIRPSEFQGEIFPVCKKPANLKRMPNGTSPLQLALNKYGHQTKPFLRKHIKAASNSILMELIRLSGDMDVRIATEQEAIFGINGSKYIKRMDMVSSPGWPYQCLIKGELGKKYLFDLEEQKINNDLLKRNVELRESMAKEGKRFPSVWRDCMKDELRPIEKVDAGKTRLFNIAPVDFTIVLRKYFLAFNDMFYKNHNKFFSAVGINPESFEWTESYNRLNQYGDKCVAGDFSTFDGTLMPELIEEFCEIVNNWYAIKGECTDEDMLVRRVLIDEIIHTTQLVQNCVYSTHQGNPSGNPLTVILNTVVNELYMRCSWLEIMEKECPQLYSCSDYSDNAISEVYGDDNRLVVKNKVIQYFNQLTITECLAKHGITYTTSTKGVATEPWIPLIETTFLKRAYRFDPEVGKEIILPQIEIETIGSFTNWYRQPADNDIDTQMENVMRAIEDFAFFHGREFYETKIKEFYFKLIKTYPKFKYINKTFDEQLTRFLAIVHGDNTTDFMRCLPF